MIDKCNFCNKITEIESTSMVGWYCVECHKIVIEQSKEAIETIKELKKHRKEQKKND